MDRTSIKRKNYKGLLKNKAQNTLSPDIVYKSVLTEKSVNLELTKNIITFIVPAWATKTLIAECVNNVFKTKVKTSDVNTLAIPSKTKHFKGRRYYTTAYRKAIVRLESLKSLSEVL